MRRVALGAVCLGWCMWGGGVKLEKGKEKIEGRRF